MYLINWNPNFGESYRCLLLLYFYKLQTILSSNRITRFFTGEIPAKVEKKNSARIRSIAIFNCNILFDRSCFSFQGSETNLRFIIALNVC